MNSFGEKNYNRKELVPQRTRPNNKENDPIERVVYNPKPEHAQNSKTKAKISIKRTHTRTWTTEPTEH